MLCKKKRSLFLFLLVLILFSSYVYSEPLTETQDADCVDDFCTLTDYLYPVFPIDSTNNSRYVYDVFRITKNEDDLTFHYNGTNGMYNITFETGVFYNNNYYSMAQVKVLKPAINFNFPIQKEKIKLKYAVNITNIDTDLQANINNITLTYKSHEGFDIFQLIKNGKQYKIGVMNLLFDGLIESGFNIDIASDERRIYISNLRYDGNALYLGSNVQYHNGTLKNKYSYVVNNTIESSLAKLNAYPYLVKNNEIQDFTLSQKLNFNSSYKLAFKSKEDINVFVEYFNGSDWVKFDFNKSNGFYYTNTFIINGINSSSFRIKPTHKNLLYNDVFEYNISLISDDLILEYLELDPYVNVTGCREDEEAISCTGSLTGNYLLNTTKTINISHSTIDANDVNPTLLIINTTGKLSILNSSLNVNAPANSNNANLKILAQNMNISNSTIDASTANTASSVTMGSSTVLIDGGNITLGDNLRIYANAGNATGTGTTAAGSDSTFTLKSRGNITFKNNVWIMAYGTNTPSSGGSTYLGGGNSIFRVDAKNIDFGTNTHIYAHGGYDNNGGDDDGYSSFNINATQLIMKDAYIDTWGLGVESTNTNNMFFIAINNSEYPNSTIIYNTTLIGSNKFNVTSISQVNITDATLDFNQEDNGILNLYGITELFINNSNFQFNIGSPTINITANKVDINNLTLTMNSGATNTKINSISYPLNITNSFINMKASANSNNANLELKALSSDIFILPTSTIDASTANTASSVTMGSSTVLIDGGNITLGDNLRIYANAGNATGTGTTAAGSDSTFTLKSRGNITFKNNVWIMAYGTNTPSSGGSTYLGGGNSIFRVDAKNIDFGTNTHIYAHGGYDNNGGDDLGQSKTLINSTNRTIFRANTLIDLKGLGVETLSKFNLSAGNEIVFYNPVNVTLQSGTTNIINLSASENARLGIFNLDWLVSTTVQCTNGLTVGTSGRTDQAFTYSCTYTNITEAQYFAPTITTPIITPTTAYTTSKLNCSTIPSVEGGGNLNVSFWWFKNNDSMTNFDSNATCLSGDTCYVTKLYTTSLTAWNFSHFDNITCMAQANVSSASNKQNSSLKFINNSVPFFDSNALIILPTFANDTHDLQCNSTTTNTHDDDINDTVLISYNWANSTNGLDFTWLAFTNVTFPNGNTSTNQHFICAAQPLDNWNTGVISYSSSVQIGSSNSAPIINEINITTNNLISNSTTPTNNNSYILIGVNWTDIDNDNTSIHVCKTTAFASGRCTGGYWGISTANTTNNTIFINYTLGNFTQQLNTIYSYATSTNSYISSYRTQTFEINFPPDTSSLSSPANNTQYASTVVSTTLDWSASTDSNSDNIRYIVYGDASPNPTAQKANITATSYLWSSLSQATWYWKVLAVDEHGYSTYNSTIYQFTIESVSSPQGGGTAPPQPSPYTREELIQVAQANICGNKLCETGEFPRCRDDCVFGIGWNFDDIFNCFDADKSDRCVIDEAPLATVMIGIIIVVGIGGIIVGTRKKQDNKKNPYLAR